MPIEKRTVVDQIEITRDGFVQIRFAKELVDTDGTVLLSAPHRAACPPGSDIDAQMLEVNQNLVEGLGYPAVAVAETEQIKSIAAAAWTPAIVAAYQQRTS